MSSAEISLHEKFYLYWDAVAHTHPHKTSTHTRARAVVQTLGIYVKLHMHTLAPVCKHWHLFSAQESPEEPQP